MTPFSYVWQPMRQTIIKYLIGSFILLLTSLSLGTLQPLLMEVFHQMTHWGDSVVHHHLDEHDDKVGHTHAYLVHRESSAHPLNLPAQRVFLTDLFSLSPVSATDYLLDHIVEDGQTTAVVGSSDPHPRTIFLACESPPPKPLAS